jgi:hypothetical protein
MASTAYGLLSMRRSIGRVYFFRWIGHRLCARFSNIHLANLVHWFYNLLSSPLVVSCFNNIIDMPICILYAHHLLRMLILVENIGEGPSNGEEQG